MCDSNLKSLIDSVVSDFVNSGILFTALDVSNKVKETMPFARHREIRDEVRNAWINDIEPHGYGRSPITVNLSDGTTAEALLYHPLSDSWDLDAKYDAQQRSKTSARAANAAPATVTIGAASVSVSNNGTIVTSSQSQPVSAVAPTPVAPAPVIPASPMNAKDLWNNMFQTQPSLFPRR
jgi:hypothetical protein